MTLPGAPKLSPLTAGEEKQRLFRREMIHLAKPSMSGEEVERQTVKSLDSAEKHARIFAYNTAHKRKKPYPK